jgi:uncharacterized protein
MDQHLEQGLRLFNDGEFFRSHEVLEEAWKLEHGSLRLFLQALIHFAVGFHHHQRGNNVGAVRQLRKGITKLSAYTPSCEGVDTIRLHRDILAALEAIEAGVPSFPYPQMHRSPEPDPKDD